MVTKLISIDDLAVGMYVVGLDKPWLWSPFLFHRRYIKSEHDIALLQDYGVRRVTIDPTRGKDVPEVRLPSAAASLLPQCQESQELPRSDPSPALPDEGETTPEVLACELQRARRVQEEARTAVQGIFEGVKTGARIDSTSIKTVVDTLMETILKRHEAFLCLIHTQQFDNSLFAHSVNSCALALVVGSAQGFAAAELERLGLGALLHDIGMMRLPRNIYRKRGVYTEQERRLIQEHPRLGGVILAECRGLHEDVVRMTMEHHERIDGSGYPLRLRGTEISTWSQIVAIADVYDAMLSEQRWRPALPPAMAIRDLYESARAGVFDLAWVEKAIRCLGIYPVGSLVQLNTGERGVVIATHPTNALRPSVQLLWAAADRLYHPPLLVDLTAPRPGEPERTILWSLDPKKEHLDLRRYLERDGVSP